MSTVNYFLYAQRKGKLAPIYLRLIHGKPVNLIARSGFFIYPEHWGKKGINKKILSEEDEQLKQGLSDLRIFIDKEVHKNRRQFNMAWLNDVVRRFHNDINEEVFDYITWV